MIFLIKLLKNWLLNKCLPHFSKKYIKIEVEKIKLPYTDKILNFFRSRQIFKSRVGQISTF